MIKQLMSALIFTAVTAQAQVQTTSQIEKKVDALLAKMTLEEKVGQMTQITIEALLKTKNGTPIMPLTLDPEKVEVAFSKYKIGSVLNVGGDAITRAGWQQRIEELQKVALQQRLKIPMLYGVDAIRGNNYTLESVMFPQQIAQAASFNVKNAHKLGEITAYETRASSIPWTFSPVLDLGRQPMWPRIWETYGEDPYLISEIGKATVKGFQGDALVTDKYHVAACLKHYMGYSMPLSGHDRTPAWIPERELREYFLPQFAESINNGAKTVMINSAEINGVPVHASHHILTDILKDELNFQGFAVSDWQDIQYLHQRHHVTKDNKESTMVAINAGIDMSMVPFDFTFTEDLIDLVKEGKVKMTRIDDAVRRILRVKYEVNLFEQPINNPKDYPLFNSKQHNQFNYDFTAECITLLKNKENILPLKKGTKILVTGPTANTMRSLNGGWSRNWQGNNSDETEASKNTILEGIEKAFGENISYEAGADFDKILNISAAVEKANQSDVIVLCLGENSYTENPGNIGDLNLPNNQIELAKAMAKTGKPIILILAEGRPRIVSAVEPLTEAVLQTYFLGNEGGDVVANTLIGNINPSGKLPYTYPRSSNSLINYYHKYTESLNFDEAAGYHPQWEFGFGLSYTTFAYSNLKISSADLTPTNTIEASVDVKNIGKTAGKEAVLMYVSDLVASITPEVKRLRAFDKIDLKPGETKTVKFTINKDELSFINSELKRVTEPGEFNLSIGGLTKNFNYKE
ncbi:MAG: glycoside hydrolase family 3 N-terminal domain-containing protein [Pelobium sp.]